MKKIILIGETWCEISFDSSHAVNSYPGGLMACIASELVAMQTVPILLTEIGRDITGQRILASLTARGINCEYADTMADKTSIALRYPEGIAGRPERYDAPSVEGFDIRWPRVEAGDVVVFGGYLALDSRVRERLMQFISNCIDHKARIVYLPAVADERIRRITKVMPYVFENLEVANAVITLPGDIDALYSTSDPAKAFKSNIAFYSPGAAIISGSGSEASATLFGDIDSASVPATAPLYRLVASIIQGQ